MMRLVYRNYVYKCGFALLAKADFTAFQNPELVPITLKWWL